MLSRKISKLGQIGETVTWVVATIIILVILMFFIFGAVTLSQTKKLGSFKASFSQKGVSEKGDSFLEKSLFTYYDLPKEEDKKFLMGILEKKEQEGYFNLKLAELNKQIRKRYLSK